MNRTLPARLLRLMNDAPSVDVEKRTIEAVVATRLLARDGGILLPGGIDVRAFSANPVVQAMHGFMEGKFPVVGRTIALTKTDREFIATTQFAETKLGEEIAYLYGVNPKREVYCRGWSFGWTSYETEWISLDEARVLLGADYDDSTVPAQCERNGVWVCKRGEMLEYSAVSVGADRAALSRAFNDGIRAAGEMITLNDLKEAQAAISDLRRKTDAMEGELKRLESEMSALRRDGAAAAARGDTAALLESLRTISVQVK